MPTNETADTLTRGFYLRDANSVARELLGKLLVHRSAEGTTSGIIVETEAYAGPEDKGAHSFSGRRTARTEIQFGPGGYAYVFAIYGMHSCFNVVTNLEDKPEVVLIRALEPADGIELMRQRRGTSSFTELCSGPGKLCKAMGITRAQYGLDLCGSELYLVPMPEIEESRIMVSPRINIDYAEECRDYMWRYFIKDDPCVSRVDKRYLSRQRSIS